MKTAFFILVMTVSLNGLSQIKSRINRVNQNRIRPDTSGQVSNINQQSTNGALGAQRFGDFVPAGVTAERLVNARGVPDSTNFTRSDTATSGNGAVNGNRDTATGRVGNNPKSNGSIAGGNDTTFNVNTLSGSTVTSGLGAIDRSGQGQFGQSNWGNSRSTVGESQWTVPPPITASFNKEFPASNAATWTRNNVDTTIYSSKYKSGAQWVTTNYSANGQRINRRTEYPILQPPRPVTVFIARQPSGFRVAAIYRLQVQGKPDVYEIETSTGKKIYLNNDGMEVNY